MDPDSQYEDQARRAYAQRWGIPQRESTCSSGGPHDFVPPVLYSQQEQQEQEQLQQRYVGPSRRGPSPLKHQFSGPHRSNSQPTWERPRPPSQSAWRTQSQITHERNDLDDIAPKDRHRQALQPHRGPRENDRRRSRSLSPDSRREVTLEGLALGISANQLHSALDEACEHRGLAMPIEVILLRDKHTRDFIGSAVAIFERIHQASRFAEAANAEPEALIAPTLMQQSDEGAQTTLRLVYSSEDKRGDAVSDTRRSNNSGKRDESGSGSSSNPAADAAKRATAKHTDEDALVSSSKKGSTQPAHQTAERKKDAANIANWQKKQQELHDLSERGLADTSAAGQQEALGKQSDTKEATAESGRSLTPPSDVALDFFTLVQDHKSTSDADTADSNQVRTIACYLCSRKFKTIEMVRRHELESNLHKNNLADAAKRKQGAEALNKARDADDMSAATTAGGMKRKVDGPGFVPVTAADPPTDNSSTDSALASSTASEGPRYRDRAQERRSAFGISLADSFASSKKAKMASGQPQRVFEGPPPPSTSASEARSRVSPPPVAASPQIHIDESNVGSRLLQSMGWTQGKGIGASSDGTQAGENSGGRAEPVEAVVGYGERAGIGSLGQSGASSVSASDQSGWGWKNMSEQAREGRYKRYGAAQ